jgi:hypothetical protein
MSFDIGARHGLSDVDNLRRLQWCLNNVLTLICGTSRATVALDKDTVYGRGAE